MMSKFNVLPIAFWLWLLIAAGFPLDSNGQVQPASSSQVAPQKRPAGDAEGDRTLSALMVSDIHFDPFHDPDKVRQLVDAPVGQWRSILSALPSGSQQQAFAALQQKCHSLGVDTPYVLLDSSLQAMRSRQPDAKFMTVSGDLIAHSFTCRYTTLLPDAAQSDYQAFVLKTLSFVTGELRAAFPGIPVYVALGNNDSPCGDYRFNAGSDFLVQAGKIVAEGLAASQQTEALKAFATGGYYSVTMEAPMRDTRLIVVNDIFLSPHYRTCAGAADTVAGNAEMKWLQGQLAQARKLGQRVWVMGHIPPGVDPYSTVAKFKDICGGAAPEMFLVSDKLADLMIEYGDVIRLGIFAHSHMDEMRVLEPGGSGPRALAVAIKLVPSISPVDGNNPSYTVARINPASAILEDYEVIAASNQTGIATTWSREYDYAQSYHEAQFSTTAVKKLIAGFESDSSAMTGASQEYIRNYYVGDRFSQLKPFWPLYVCAMGNYTAKAYAACACPAAR
jgi:sphingomyelin phosphodiesterase acid-like 3